MRWIPVFLLLSSVALAGDKVTSPGPPSLPDTGGRHYLEVGITQDEIAIVVAALQKLKADAPDPSLIPRIDGTLTSIARGIPFGGRDVPLIGLALSRASADPKVCTLYLRIEPKAVCVK